MPEIATPVPGTFCWVELETTDPAGAKAFYSTILGWKLVDVPGPGVPYAMAEVRGKGVAGLMELPEVAKKMGAPPSWLSYVAVEDVAASTAKATKLGAKAFVPPTPMGSGTFSVLQDPTGAVFALWRAEKPMGTFLKGEIASLGWNELVTTDVKAATAFYTSLFGWKATAQSMSGIDYTMFHQGEQPVGGMLVKPAGMTALNHWAVYFVVDDADAVFALAQEAGASVLAPLRDLPTVGRFGFLTDPQGAAFALIKFEPRAA